eukprot:PITA_03780
MANERLDKLETNMRELKSTLDDLANMVWQAFVKGKEPALEDHYNDHEGESSHSPHAWRTHPAPNRDLPLSQRPPKLDMQKFDGSNPSAGLAQMEQYFELNRLEDDWTKIRVATMYLDSQRWQWALWHQRRNAPFSSWVQFTKALRDRFEQGDSFLGSLTKLRQTGTVDEYITAFEALAFRTQHLSDEFYTECFISGLKEAIKAQGDSFLGSLTKLRQTGTVDEYITAFEALAFRTQHLSDEFYTECFISGLKEAIKAQVLLHHPPTWSEACQVTRKVERPITAQYSRPNFPTKGRPPQAHTTTQTLKVQKVSPQEMAKRRKQGLCYYCDEKYSPGHKCKEPKFFQIDATDYSSTEEDPPLEE